MTDYEDSYFSAISSEIRPRKSGIVEAVDISGAPSLVNKGDLLGWFNMGSTVILLLPKDACAWSDALTPGETVVMGRPIGTVSPVTE